MSNYYSKTIMYAAIAMAVFFTGCATISKFDQYAYSQSTSVKVDALNLMDQATDSATLHVADIATVRSSIEKIYAYENNRPKNTISAKMWSVMKDSTGHLFGGFITRWQKEKKLDAVFIAESKLLIGDAFDQISQLESGKIKSQQVTN
jgi:VCBS repeat-containing protein